MMRRMSLRARKVNSYFAIALITLCGSGASALIIKVANATYLPPDKAAWYALQGTD